jgi:AcrR family transcriptional regulator
MSSDRVKYRLKARALGQQRTRERIVGATAALHEEVGPARTTVAEIARRAGVQRLTVYNNFPELGDLLQACQSDFLARHPPPDIAPTGYGQAQLARLEQALRDLYGWYRANRAMETHIHRDRHLVPELDELLQRSMDPGFDAAATAYAEALTEDPGCQEDLRRLVRVAIEFRTWQLLADAGAGDPDIARLFESAATCLRSRR